MLITGQSKGITVLAAASLVSAVLGSIHAFSVFLAPLEQVFGTTRSQVSLSYSMALMALTFVVLLGPKIYNRGSAAAIILTSCGLAAAGALIAGMATSLSVVWLGYSLIFGMANGLGYGFGLQIAAQVNPGREGLAMGIVTAAYALGAMVAPGVFDMALAQQGFGLAMTWLAVVLISVGLVSAAMMHSVSARFVSAAEHSDSVVAPIRSQVLLWLGYFGGVLAGLMVLGHAAGIATAFRPQMVAWLAPVVISASNLLGSLVAGRLADRMSLRALLAGLALMTAAALAAMAVFGAVVGLMISFALIGFAYGGTIAAYPAAVAKLFGMHNSARIYGRVFTAWGAAGLAGPWLAGALYDWSGDYRVALIVAAGMGLMSAMAITILFMARRV